MPAKYTPEQQILSFWSRVNKNGSIPEHCPELGHCWVWTSSLRVDGYGQFTKKRLKTHRISWMLTYGEIPEGLNVLHKCDNKACCNPAHLFLGTQQDNVDDMMTKGRQATAEQIGLKGEANPAHKLTALQVTEIRQRYAAGGISKTQLGNEYRIDRTVIGKIIRRQSWKD